MKEDEKKAMYESPVTKETPVNLESGICASSTNVQNPDDEDNGRIKGHEVNTDFGGGWTNDNWD